MFSTTGDREYATLRFVQAHTVRGKLKRSDKHCQHVTLISMDMGASELIDSVGTDGTDVRILCIQTDDNSRTPENCF